MPRISPKEIERDEAVLGMSREQCVAQLFPSLANWPQFLGPDTVSFEGRLACLRHLAAWLALTRVEQIDFDWKLPVHVYWAVPADT